MSRKIIKLLTFAAINCCIISPASAITIQFTPPTDPLGAVLSTNLNDGYSAGRGQVFQMLNDVTINSVGIFHDLTNFDLFFEIARSVVGTGRVTVGQTVLRQGNSTVSTNGLEWIDFAIRPLTLAAGNFYHIEFKHGGSGNQNFFHVQFHTSYTQREFSLIDGTQGGETKNTVVPGLRVGIVSKAPIPEPAAIVLLGTGLLGLVGYGWRRQAI